MADDGSLAKRFTEECTIKPNSGVPKEIWGLICKQLALMSMQSLCQVACTSKILRRAATPHIYATITISSQSSEDYVRSLFTDDRRLEHLRIHTKEIRLSARSRIGRDDIYEAVVELMDHCPLLETLSWYAEPNNRLIEKHGWGEQVRNHRSTVPPEIINEVLQKRNLKFDTVVECYSSECSSKLFNSYIAQIALISFDYTVWTEQNDFNPQLVATFLAKFNLANLQTLSITMVRRFQQRSGLRWFLPPGHNRLPPVANLNLRNYNWPLKLNYYQDVFDFANLRSLTLEGVTVLNFFTQVPLDDLANLVSLTLSDMPCSMSIRPASITIPDIKTELWPRLKQLESLSIHSTWSDYLDLRMLSLLSPRLKDLDLSTAPNTSSFIQKSLCPHDIEYILQKCPNLRSFGAALAIGLLLQDFSSEYLGLLTSFTNLVNLRLDLISRDFKDCDLLQPSDRPLIMFEDGTDSRNQRYDVDGHALISLLLDNKSGLAFKEIYLGARITRDRLDDSSAVGTVLKVYSYEVGTEEVWKITGNSRRIGGDNQILCLGKACPRNT